MTMKFGFEVGLILGFMAFLFLDANIVFTPATIVARGLIAFYAVLIFPIFSLILGTLSIFEGHAIGGTTFCGFIYGFTTALDIPYILHVVFQFLQGNLPLPWQT